MRKGGSNLWKFVTNSKKIQHEREGLTNKVGTAKEH